MKFKYFIHYLVRLVYYKFGINGLYNPFKVKQKEHYRLTIEDIQTALEKMNIRKGDTIIVHSSLKNINSTPEALVNFLKEFIGPNGNILMPSHPKLETENGNQVYNVDKSPSTVGYLTEYFRKSEGVSRSEHPFSSIAVWGKDKDFLLKDNINDNKPLPHGIYSPYYKVAQMGGKAILLGVTPRRATIMHTAEEVIDEDFPVKDFFKEYKVKIINKNQNTKNFIVRKANLDLAKLYLSKSKVIKEWYDDGAIKAIDYNGTKITFVDCELAVNGMIQRIKLGSNSYPLAPKKSKSSI